MCGPDPTIQDLERRLVELESAKTEGPRRKRIKAAAAVVTFLIAVAGAIFGGISFSSAQRIRVSITPRYIEAQRPGTYRVGIVNSSARAVNMVAGEVLVDGQVLADISQVLPLVADNFDLRTAAELQQQARELPYSVGVGESIAGTITFAPRFGMSDDNDPRLNERIELLYGKAKDNPVDPGERVKLRLRFEPGGERTEIVRFAAGGHSGRFNDVDHLPGWTTWINLTKGRWVFRAGGPGDVPALATLRLWRGADGGTPLLSRTRPLIVGWTHFPLPPLKRGAYFWALASASRVVAVGDFAIPCKGAFEQRLIQPDTAC